MKFPGCKMQARHKSSLDGAEGPDCDASLNVFAANAALEHCLVPGRLVRGGPPTYDASTMQALNAIEAKGAMPPLVLAVEDCRTTYERMRAKGVEFTQEPMDRYGTVDAGFRDPSGNGWKMIERR